ncbi:MAG: hypothetical protein IKP50_00350 [Bacilli bacterium]|nr:hypothetical protein [Bacilli bacterium]
MDLLELKSQIMHNELSNFYIFTGTEISIQRIYLNQISKVLNMPINRVDSVASIYGMCTTKGLFGNTNSLYVIREDRDIMKQEKVYETLSKDIGGNVIILLYEKIDSRLKFGKYFKNVIVPFEKLSNNVLKMYIKKEIDLDQKHLEDLSNKVSGSYDIALLEADKIKKFSEAQNISANSAMDKLVQMGMIVQEEDTDVFRWVAAVMNRQVTLSFHLAKILLNKGTQPINMLGTLYNSVKTVLLIQCCEGRDISGITGLDGGQIYFNKPYINVYQTYELVDSMKRLSRIINNIKNGTIDNQFAIDLALTQML